MQHCHPKGCYCQAGSVFKTVFFLLLILGVSTALAVWIYHKEFAPKEDADVNEGNGLTARDERAVDLFQLLRGGGGPDVYIDNDGTLQLISELRENPDNVGGEFGPAHLTPAGERPKMWLPVESIEKTKTLPTKRPRTILEEILQHLDSEESMDTDVDGSGEEIPIEAGSCRMYKKPMR